VHAKPIAAHPEGVTFVRHGHCVTNPSHRDQLYREEMQDIAEEFFPTLSGPHLPRDPEFENRKDQFDLLIRGWTKYWNEILQPKESLDPCLVKALIESESGFDSKADNGIKGSGRARGLLQITDGTRKILRDDDGELKNHLVTLTDKDSYDPDLNIAAGIRWLFYKRERASAKLKREASWMEGAFEFKRIRQAPRTRQEKERFPVIRKRLEDLYEKLGGGSSK
jgi:hypothetical protein